MKKTLLLGLLALGSYTASAQIANGTAAPDFTATDVNGVTHNLYDYLNQGKTVILDISATWCGPCWNYHGSNALANLHNSYGPGGSNEVVVLFVEGDPQTTSADLQGSGPNTQGNWLEHSPYPVIDNGSISTIFNLEYFPTVVRICPDGIMTEIGALGLADLKSSIMGCGGPLVGIASHASIAPADQSLCAAPESLTMQARMRNLGNNQITAATVVLKENGTVVSTKNYTGNLGFGTSTNLSFTNVALNPAAEYEVVIQDINGAAQTNENISTHDLHINVAPQSPNVIEVRVHTGNYPTEMKWNIKGSNGTVVAQAGPYAGNPNGGGADANTTKIHTFTLPEGTDCYSVELQDTYGDGWMSGSGQGIEVFAGGTLVASKMNPGNFGTSLVLEAAFVTNGVMATPNTALKGFAIYPNPSTGVFNLTTQEAVDVTVLDITGKVVQTAKGLSDGSTLNLGGLQKGMYIAKINGAASEKVEKLIIQ
ncbi:T9SS type A sorting domain-containing protein [Flavobacterium sp.]|uniref:T9SS type A sorting domain-containing protein n=1 Tax=Flavobacterium sp. TaxID=239 RepID=UPI004033949F